MLDVFRERSSQRGETSLRSEGELLVSQDDDWAGTQGVIRRSCFPTVTTLAPRRLPSLVEVEVSQDVLRLPCSREGARWPRDLWLERVGFTRNSRRRMLRGRSELLRRLDGRRISQGGRFDHLAVRGGIGLLVELILYRDDRSRFALSWYPMVFARRLRKLLDVFDCVARYFVT